MVGGFDGKSSSKHGCDRAAADAELAGGRAVTIELRVPRPTSRVTMGPPSRHCVRQGANARFAQLATATHQGRHSKFSSLLTGLGKPDGG